MSLRVTELHVHYGFSHVLHGVSLAVERGEVVAVLGRNGVGKTTLLSTIMGLVRPTSGSITLGSTRLDGMLPEDIARQGVALVPQNRRLFRNLRVRENLEVVAVQDEDGLWPLADLRRRFPVLRSRWNHAAGQLSGGEQQIVSVTRALVRQSDMLLMDEPLEGLAPFIVRSIMDVIVEARGHGKGVLLVEQKIGVAIELADRVLIMTRGTIAHQGSPEEVMKDRTLIAELLGV